MSARKRRKTSVTAAASSSMRRRPPHVEKTAEMLQAEGPSRAGSEARTPSAMPRAAQGSGSCGVCFVAALTVGRPSRGGPGAYTRPPSRSRSSGRSGWHTRRPPGCCSAQPGVKAQQRSPLAELQPPAAGRAASSRATSVELERSSAADTRPTLAASTPRGAAPPWHAHLPIVKAAVAFAGVCPNPAAPVALLLRFRRIAPTHAAVPLRRDVAGVGAWARKEPEGNGGPEQLTVRNRGSNPPPCPPPTGRPSPLKTSMQYSWAVAEWARSSSAAQTRAALTGSMAAADRPWVATCTE